MNTKQIREDLSTSSVGRVWTATINDLCDSHDAQAREIGRLEESRKIADLREVLEALQERLTPRRQPND